MYKVLNNVLHNIFGDSLQRIEIEQEISTMIHGRIVFTNNDSLVFSSVGDSPNGFFLYIKTSEPDTEFHLQSVSDGFFSVGIVKTDKPQESLFGVPLVYKDLDIDLKGLTK